MPRPSTIDPITGKRRDFVPPEKRGALAAVIEETKQAEAQERLLRRKRAQLKARTSLLAYTQYTMPDPEAPDDVTRSKYEARPFHVAIAEALETVERGEVPQLIFVMPPRHGKTELATQRLAAWISGRHPDWDIAVASYSDDMASNTIGANTRAILTSPQHRQVFPEYGLRKGSTAKDNLQTTKGGRLVFVGRGGPLTGRGMHVGLGDDLFKDHEEARSPAIRDQAWNWFTKVFMTRRMGKKLVILTMTRWHSDDIIGRLTDPENPYYNEIEAKRWKIIKIPAIAGENDSLGRKPGEPLWPIDAKGESKYDLDFLESQRRMDPLGFEALYQQEPTVADGVLFRRENIRYYRPEDLPDNLRYYCASDHAVGTTQRNDPSCFIKVGIDQQGNIYLIDVFWQRARTDVAVEALLTMASMPNSRPLIWWAERGQISKSIGPFLRKRMLESRRFVNIVEVTPAVDKEQRAQSIAARIGMGMVFWPIAKPWTERSVSELMAFPNGNHDDFVDALAYIGLGLRSQVNASAPPKKEETPAFGTLAWVKYTEKWDQVERDRQSAGGF